MSAQGITGKDGIEARAAKVTADKIYAYQYGADNTEPWTEEAACASVGGELWYPDDGEDRQTPKRICLNRCPVREECLDYAMRREQGKSESYRWGIFGGLSPAKRAKYEAQWLAGQVAA